MGDGLKKMDRGSKKMGCRKVASKKTGHRSKDLVADRRMRVKKKQSVYSKSLPNLF